VLEKGLGYYTTICGERASGATFYLCHDMRYYIYEKVVMLLNADDSKHNVLFPPSLSLSLSFIGKRS
jgi:hypothetical protein